jgi:succinoglycan biosynthesis protein ExoM
MAQKPNHVSVCICTYKRAHLLRRTLEDLRHQATEGLFDYSIVVADNDRLESARQVVGDFARSTVIETDYCVEPEQNISLARNKALARAKGDYVALIDDDEFPSKDWLLIAFRACSRQGIDGVLGPVKPFFEQEPPRWVVRGKLCERADHSTGLVLSWQQTTTANVFFRRRILDGIEEPFRPQFGSGCEDNDFFKRMIELGRVFIWCQEAVVHEFVPPERWRRRYLFKRALLRGQNNRHFADVRGVAKSIIAVPAYGILLPLLLVLGHHLFMRYLIKLGDHAGKLLGLMGLRPMGNKYLAG